MVSALTSCAIIFVLIPCILSAAMIPKQKSKYLLPPSPTDPEAATQAGKVLSYRMEAKKYGVGDFYELVQGLNTNVQKEYESVNNRVKELMEKVHVLEKQIKESDTFEFKMSISAVGVAMVGILVGVMLATILFQTTTKFCFGKAHKKPIFPTTDVQRKILLSDS
ncbi:hypothetical protein DdX_11241 [Ditylenchus destructor]|uniref:Uncharacterized protein n=1 Tax=Ditylenchus destructor TaxID=166010 RepID=A0AAD4N2I8_9BILA|nr:hypothetical protein DdX_11241 [Ditylenchus destructor]